MAVMSKEVKDLFASVKTVVFATARPDAQPNACIVGMKRVIDDETIYLSDQFFKKTLANVCENPKVAVVFWGEEGAYQIHGTARYVDKGPEFEEQKAYADELFAKMGMPIQAKGGCFVHVDAVYSSKAGPTAGEQLA